MKSGEMNRSQGKELSVCRRLNRPSGLKSSEGHETRHQQYPHVNTEANLDDL